MITFGDPGDASACAIASCRLPAPVALVFETVNEVGVVRSSSRSKRRREPREEREAPERERDIRMRLA
ncbi:hypothetical protein FRUB_02912 [Fimbriiglobus ruber]|uniref:Uncharacterized protein n=1 Tax=Fimbriiglobus ruber TaxID=1908690 RepID=A0A225DQE9_9BACT|nr:hypothetical protein FRUB_02912 [Fimbriiglobus ruber]